METNTEQEIITIYNHNTTKFSGIDKLRILFGKPHYLNVTIKVDKHTERVIESKCTLSVVEKIFPKKMKGGLECNTVQN